MIALSLDDDPGYLAWMQANPDGFVLNAHRRPVPTYLVLHQSGCPTIARASAEEGSWTRIYSKFCATERRALEAVARDICRAAGFSKVCSHCLGIARA